ncbi:MAG: GAF domain-containing protein [Chloroflexi bacterium]|nr:GAF domain-containing protein [Chloroflexota bacterium]
MGVPLSAVQGGPHEGLRRNLALLVVSLGFALAMVRIGADRETQRRRSEEQAKKLAAISARFVDPKELDEAINASLADIGVLSRAGRAYLFLLREGGTIMDNSHEWCAPGVSPQIDNLKNLPVDTFPWWMARLRNGEVIHITDVSRLPPEAKAEKDILEAQDIKSLLVLPVEASGALAGFIGLDNVRGAGPWDGDVASMLRVSSQIIGGALGRWRAQRETEARGNRLQALYDVSRALTGPLKTQALARLALEEALKASTLDAGIIRYYDQATNELVILAARGLPPELEATIRAKAGRVKLGLGLAGEAAQTGKPIVVEGVEDDERCLIPDLSRFGFHSAAYLPLKAEDSVVGVISGYAKLKRPFKHEDLDMLETLGTMVGAALANARLFEQAQEARDDWQQTFDAMSEGMAIINPDRRILRANRALGEMLGTTPGELVGKPCHLLIHGLDSPPANCPTCACITSKLPCAVVWQEPHLGGRWLRLRGDPVLDGGGQVVRIIHAFADITQEKKQQLAVESLYDLSLALSGILDVNEVVGVALQHVERTFGQGHCTVGIGLLDRWGQWLDMVEARGPGREAMRGVSLPLNQMLPEGTRTLFQERRSWLQSDISQSSPPLIRLPAFPEIRSFVSVPLVAGDRALGVVFLASSEPDLPSGDELALLETHSREIALAVHNAQLFASTDAELRHRIAEWEALCSVIGSASKSLDLDIVLREVLKRAALALHVDATGVALMDEEAKTLTLRAAYETKNDSYHAVGLKLDLASFPSLQALVNGGPPISTPDTHVLTDGAEKALARQWRARSVLAVPISLAGRVLGTVQFTTENTAKTFTDDDVSLAMAIGGHLAPVLENAKLHQHTAKDRSTLESIITSMGEGLIVVSANDQILYCNQAIEKLLGVRCQDFVGLPVEAFWQAVGPHVDNAETLHKGWENARSRLQERPRLDFQVTSVPAPRHVEVTFFPVGDRPNLLGTGVLFRDVTRERELDRMKTEFISVASHELRTPITSIYGFSELLMMKATGLPEAQRKWVEIVHSEGKRMSAIVEDLLNVSRIEAGKLSLNLAPVSLPPLAAEIIDQFRVLSQDHWFEVEMPDGLPEVQADSDKLRQVVYNLLDNAVKYSPGGGPVKVAATSEHGGKEVRISISDKGLGIPAEEIPKLYTRFHRVQRLEVQGVRGTGLGLYICKSLVEMMRGRIWVESTLGKGTTFYVSLPAVLS